MSLMEDLARNRAVFDRLTGALHSRVARTIHVMRQAEESTPDRPAAPRGALEAASAPPPRVQSFSLAYGALKTPSAFSAPARSGGPGQGGEAARAPTATEKEPADPMELLDYRLEVENRRISQPMQEEDFE